MRKNKRIFAYFHDPECSKPIVGEWDFPYRITADEKSELLVYAKNITPCKLDSLEFKAGDPHITITPSSTEAYPMDVIQLKVVLDPKGEKVNLKSEMMIKGRTVGPKSWIEDESD